MMALPGTAVRYLTGTDEEPSFKVEAISPQEKVAPVDATAVLLAHDVPMQNDPARKLHFVEVLYGERRIWVRSCIQ